MAYSPKHTTDHEGWSQTEIKSVELSHSSHVEPAFLVSEQREPLTHGASSITHLCWTTKPQGKGSVWPGWLSMMQFSFLFLWGLRRKYNWEISGAFSSSSKSFAYILCSHTNHQLKGLAVFVLEDCLAGGACFLSWQGLGVKVETFWCGTHAVLIYLRYHSFSELRWLKSFVPRKRACLSTTSKCRHLQVFDLYTKNLSNEHWETG